MRVLVAYGTKMGGTKGLAEMLGSDLEELGYRPGTSMYNLACSHSRLGHLDPAFIEIMGYDSLADLQNVTTRDLYQDISTRKALLDRLAAQD